METLEATLLIFYYDYTPNDRPKLNRDHLTMSRREVMAQLETEHKHAQVSDLDIAQDYQISLTHLAKMTDQEFHDMKRNLVPQVR